jgi:uncharacterized small protein (DUF1192 family)
MSKEPVQRYIIKRVDGFVSVCDTQDNEAPIDNSANGLEALLNALNTANTRLKAENKELKLQPDPLTAYLYAAELGKDAYKRLKHERIHDLNQIGGLQEENARLKAENERLTKAHSDALADFWGIHKGYFDLKAEVDNLRKSAEISPVQSTHELTRLKAEVERLNADNQQLQARCNFLEDKPSYE